MTDIDAINRAAGWSVADDGTIYAEANNVPDIPAVLAPVVVTDRNDGLYWIALGALAYLAIRFAR